MGEKLYHVHELVRFDYSEIGKYIDEHHTDKPLRNNEIVKLLNDLTEENKLLKNTLLQEQEVSKELKTENEMLKKRIHSITQSLENELNRGI